MNIEITEPVSRERWLRAMGVKGEADSSLMQQLKEAEKLLFKAAKPKAVYRVMNRESVKVSGFSLQKHLEGCHKVAVMALTLGIGVDNLIRKTQITDMATAVILDSGASVLIDRLCDKFEEYIKANVPEEEYATCRFSPGYGDSSLELQKSVVTYVDGQRQIGLNVTSDSLLIPRKSVTALIGLSNHPVTGRLATCSECVLKINVLLGKKENSVAIDFNDKIYILDGAMGTMLQKRGMAPGETTTQFGLKHPEIWYDIYSQYIDAGSDIIYASTFGINRFKTDELGMLLDEAVTLAMDVADNARKDGMSRTGRDIKLALGLGPLGELLEPMGTLTFEDAYDAFSEVINAGKEHGADLVVIETMTDLYEVKAAVLAAKENTDLPVIASMSFEENGRTFTGVSIESMALTLEGLGVDAMGINCSLGPAEILPMAKKLRTLTELPVFAKPNAGLPDPQTGGYNVTSRQFADTMKEFIDYGISMVGGCCGTTPEYIAGLTEYRDSLTSRPERAQVIKPSLRICSSTDVVNADHVTVIGERLNPTGKKRLKQALLDEDFDYILNQAIEQVDAGAEILDVNVGVPSLDDVSMLPKLVKKLQSVTGVPLQIDSSNPEAIEAALRVYNGKAIVNSVNGEPEVMDSILPIVKKYGAAVIGLTLDSNGIPAVAEERVAVAERIMHKALEYGIPKEDIIIDCLALTASAQQKEVNETLRAVKMVKEKLGLKTALGVSNISFGLPARIIINRTFFAMAMECGLDLPIINPNDEDMMSAVYAFNVLKNVDINAAKYIERYSNYQPQTVKQAKNAGNTMQESGGNASGDSTGIFHCIEKGLKSDTVSAVNELLQSHDELEVVNDYLIPALDKVGKGFEKGTIFLPQMLQAATAAQAGFDVIKTRLAESDKTSVSLGEVVIATVKGDIHDIGKNIVKVIMENYGFKIIDLGRDVPAEKIVEAVVSKDIKLLGLSALMTTTLKSMEETIAAVKAAAPACKIMVGGAVLTEDYAKSIGADYYCKDAMKSVEAAQEVFA